MLLLWLAENVRHTDCEMALVLLNLDTASPPATPWLNTQKEV